MRKSSAVAFQVVPVISLNEVDIERVPAQGEKNGRHGFPRCATPSLGVLNRAERLPKLLLSPCTPAHGRDAAQYGMRSGCGCKMAQPDRLVL